MGRFWGGALHASQADRALRVLGADRSDPDPRVRRTRLPARLAGPADTRVTGQVEVLPAAARRERAAAVLGEAIRLAADPDAGLLERVVARQAAHHVALATGYDTLGDYRHALHHGEHELPLRRRLQGDNHLDTLSGRANIALWTGKSGDPAGALRLFQELLPDLMRVLCPDHPDTLLRGLSVVVAGAFPCSGSEWRSAPFAVGRFQRYSFLLPSCASHSCSALAFVQCARRSACCRHAGRRRLPPGAD